MNLIKQKCLFSDVNSPLYKENGTEYCCSDCSIYNCDSNKTKTRHSYEWIEGKCNDRRKLTPLKEKNIIQI